MVIRRELREGQAVDGKLKSSLEWPNWSCLFKLCMWINNSPNFSILFTIAPTLVELRNVVKYSQIQLHLYYDCLNGPIRLIYSMQVDK